MSVKLSAQQVRKVYGTNEGAVEVLNDLSLDLYAGERRWPLSADLVQGSRHCSIF